jgi:ATP-dependent Clp endopeptidase proteolytic subunit ClpP
MSDLNLNELKLYGEIGPGGVSAQMVKEQLAAADPLRPLVVRIDSPGGSVFDGFSIYDSISTWTAGSKVIIESAAFSIASYIALAGDEVEITENGYMMIHKPFTVTEGDDDEHANAADLLRKLKASMVDVYGRRLGMDAEAIEKLMKQETWFTAAEAKKAGLVDVVNSRKKQSRLVESQAKMPTRVFASLRVSDGPVGDKDLPKGKKDMANEKVPATLKSITARYGKRISDKLKIRALEEELPLEEVGDLLLEEQESEVEMLKAELAEKTSAMAAMQEEMAKMKAELEEKAKASETMVEEPKMKARVGVRPVASAPVKAINASAVWNEAVAKLTSNGMPKADAVRRVNRENPGLREQMLQERS